MFPAPAGINRWWRWHCFQFGCVPRASGDKPQFEERARQEYECSPRQRG
ncbi:hypothetical protein JQ218_000867 [Salmonella enterica]|nr:hypothetical protein [Salmonella enterica]